MLRKKGLLLLVSGPSGVGKGTICKALFDRNPYMKFSVSATTRARREGEIDGINYFFKTRQEFEDMIENDEFLEYMILFGTNYYGTPRKYVKEEVDAGHDIILEIDVNGAIKVKQAYPEAVMIFVVPPAFSDLKSRLINRSSDSAESIDTRLEAAMHEISALDKYDYIIINDYIDKAVAQIEAIVSAEKASMKRNKDIKERLMEGR